MDKDGIKRVQKFRQLAWKRDNAHKFIVTTCPHCRMDQTARKRESRKATTVCQRCHEVCSYLCNPQEVPVEITVALEGDEAGGLGICPKCGNGVQKNMGCFNMTCRCGASFEWRASLVQNLQSREADPASFTKMVDEME